MPTNYDGLTRNTWPGTWSTDTNAPIALDTELRGTLQSISGAAGDKLTDIAGARIQEGMLVYLKTGYTAGAVTRDSDTYYTYKLQGGESRSAVTGAVPNAEANWAQIDLSGANGATGVTGASGIAGATGVSVSGATGVAGASGISGASGYVGSDGATGSTGLTGATGITGVDGATGIGLTGATGTQGIDGASGIAGLDGATGIAGLDGATGIAGATGSGFVENQITTSSTDEVVIDIMSAAEFRSAKYEMQLSYSTTGHQVSELRLLNDQGTVYLNQYGIMGDELGQFIAYYPYLNNTWNTADINDGGVAYWTGYVLKIYTTNQELQQQLLAITKLTTITLTNELGNISTCTISQSFTEVSAGVYQATTVEFNDPLIELSNIQWTGSGNIELRFTPIYPVTFIKYTRNKISI
jgi:hypothetical protein